MLTALQQERLLQRPCGCGPAELTDTGLVRRVESCSVCLKNVLDFMTELGYNANDVRGMSHERQLDMFDEDPSAEGPNC